MGRGEGPKLYPDPMRAGPAYDGALDQNRDLCLGEIEQKIHLHSRGGSKGAFKPASFAGEVQCLVNRMEMPLVDEGAGKSRLESRILSHHHNPVLFCGLPRDVRQGFHWWDYADVMPVGCDGDCPFAHEYACLKTTDSGGLSIHDHR